MKKIKISVLAVVLVICVTFMFCSCGLYVRLGAVAYKVTNCDCSLSGKHQSYIVVSDYDEYQNLGCEFADNTPNITQDNFDCYLYVLINFYVSSSSYNYLLLDTYVKNTTLVLTMVPTLTYVGNMAFTNRTFLVEVYIEDIDVVINDVQLEIADYYIVV